MENKDNLVECKRCKSDAAYKVELDNLTTYLCWGCGFTTNSNMKGDKAIQELISRGLPKLYLDLIFKDEDGLFWCPQTVNIPSKGMVFIDGSNVENWEWASIDSIKIKESEKDIFPKGTKFKSDPNTKKLFGQKGFMDAFSHIGAFDIELPN